MYGQNTVRNLAGGLSESSAFLARNRSSLLLVFPSLLQATPIARNSLVGARIREMAMLIASLPSARLPRSIRRWRYRTVRGVITYETQDGAEILDPAPTSPASSTTSSATVSPLSAVSTIAALPSPRISR